MVKKADLPEGFEVPVQEPVEDVPVGFVQFEENVFYKNAEGFKKHIKITASSWESLREQSSEVQEYLLTSGAQPEGSGSSSNGYSRGASGGGGVYPSRSAPVPDCEDCGSEIKGFVKDGRKYEAAALAKSRKERFGKFLCSNCLKNYR